MLNIYICQDCGLVQMRNPRKIRNEMSCPRCNGIIVKADISYTDYCVLDLEERQKIIEQYYKKKQ